MKIKHTQRIARAVTMTMTMGTGLSAISAISAMSVIGSAQAQTMPEGVLCAGRQQVIPWQRGMMLRLDRYQGNLSYLNSPPNTSNNSKTPNKPSGHHANSGFTKTPSPSPSATPSQQADRFSGDLFNPVRGVGWVKVERKSPATQDQDTQTSGTCNYLLVTSSGAKPVVVNTNTGQIWELVQGRGTLGGQWMLFPVEENKPIRP